MEALNEQAIKANLDDEYARRCGAIHIFESLDSTNTWLINKVRARQASSGDVCAAEMQTLGRGRRGKTWISPGNGNLYVSMVWSKGDARENQLSEAEGLLTLTLGLGIVNMLLNQGVNDVTIKWPNDVLVKGRKICGILVEKLVGSGGVHVVIGVGLNLIDIEMDEFAVENPLKSTGLIKYIPESINQRNKILAQIIKVMLKTCIEQEKNDPENIKSEYYKYDELSGKSVILTGSNGAVVQGTYAGISRNGALLVNVTGKLVEFFSADVRVRLE